MENIENQLKEFFSNIKDVKFAYLFGSYAKNTQNKNSDIDIAIYFEKDTNIFDKTLEIHHKLEILFKKEIDIVCLNSIKNNYLLIDILKNNILLKDSIDDSRELFEIYKHHEALDFIEYKKMKDVA